jgi:hypothetical protein
MLGLLVGASLACLLGLTEPPTEGTHTTQGQQALGGDHRASRGVVGT